MTTGPLPTIVRTEFDMTLVLTAERCVMVTALLDYSAHEPYSVQCTFRTSEGDVNWVFARELLAEGLRSPSGDGDVAMWPSRSGGRDVLCISLSSPNGRAMVEARSGDIEEFLARTYTIVPAGSEAALIDFDGLIERLLSDSGPTLV